MPRLRQFWLRSILCAGPAFAAAQRPARPAIGSIAPDSGVLVVHLLERRVGTEAHHLRRVGQEWVLTAALDFTDRGSRVQLEAELRTRADFTPTRFHAKGKTYRFVNVDVDVEVAGGSTRVRNIADTSTIPTPSRFFTARGYAPLAGRALLIQYWESHGRPAKIVNIPGSTDAPIVIQFRGMDSIRTDGGTVALRRYSVDGVVWGREAVWLDARRNLAALVTRVHILPLEAVRSDLDDALPQFQASAIRDRTADLATLGGDVRPTLSGTYALVGARVVDGTLRPPLDNATVLIRDGRIEAVGPRRAVAIPSGATVMDVTGKTIIPGLWDMHGHLSQMEWGPAYLAAGVTTARDMGGEMRFLIALRDAFAATNGVGPRVLLAGLIDGPGALGFGTTIATTPAEGEVLVDEYHGRGFEQIKLYNSITAPVAGAIIRRAHSVGMTVTGHVPTAMGLRAIVDSGMDHVAHMPLRGDESPTALQQLMDLLSAKGTVIDPTVAWNELLGRAPQTPVSAFESGITHAPSALALNYASVRNNADASSASAGLARGLGMLKALFDAGIPIVAGTDGGVPGYSVLREIELAVEAGLTPLQAIKTATAVAARSMRMERNVGTVETRMVADLLILDADPLVNIANIRTGHWVVREGRLYECRRLWQAAGFTPP